MRPLIVLSARATAVAVVVVLGAGMLGGLVRLLPWIVAPDVPFGLAAPFARLLATAAVEASLLVGLPVGVAIGAALLVERGEARGLAALGASPGRLLMPVAAIAALVVACYVGVSAASRPEAAGRLSARLVGAGRESCAADGGPHRVEIPLVGVTWLCFASGPRLAGRIPGLGGEAWFSAAEVTPADDLRRIDLADLHLAARVGPRSVGLRAASATLFGLPSWGAPRGATGAFRAIVVGASAWLVAMWSAWLVLGDPRARAVACAVVAVLASAAMLAVMHAIDGRAGAATRYLAVPFVGAVVTVAGLAVLRRLALPAPARIAGPRPR